MRRQRPTFTHIARMVLALGLFALSLPACAGRTLDERVDQLMTALDSCDAASIDVISVPQIATVPTKEIEGMCEVLDQLGPYQGKTRIALQDTEIGVAGRYQLAFEEGMLDFQIALADDRVMAFAFDGTDWNTASAAAAAERYDHLQVTRFSFLGPDDRPNPRGSRFERGTVRFAAMVAGLRPGQLRFDAINRVRVIASDGAHMRGVPEPEPMPMPREAGQEVGVVTIVQEVTVNEPGPFTLELEVEDRVSGETVVHRETFVVL